MKCEDYLGSDKLSEVLAQMDGKVIPIVALLNLCSLQQLDSGFMREFFTFKSSIGYLLSSEQLYRLGFPVIDGVLQWQQGSDQFFCISSESTFINTNVLWPLAATSLGGWV